MKRRLWLASILLGSVLFFAGCADNDEGALDNELGSEEAQAGVSEELPEPPGLRVLAGDEEIEVVRGAYSWSVDNKDGTITAIEADTAAPPDLVRTLSPVTVSSDETVELDFETEPDTYTVRIWEEDYKVSSERDDVLLSVEGVVIYEVLANWSQGTSTYVFTLEIE